MCVLNGVKMYRTLGAWLLFSALQGVVEDHRNAFKELVIISGQTFKENVECIVILCQVA